MLDAHKLGRQHGAEAFAKLALEAMKQFHSVDEQFSYMAGFIMELKRKGSQ